MSDSDNSDAVTQGSITSNKKAPMDLPSAIKEAIDGKAYQSIAQSTAIAVQDATDYLRNISTISTTAVGAAMAQLLATGDMNTYNQVVTSANNLVLNGAHDFRNIGTCATDILSNFAENATAGSTKS